MVSQLIPTNQNMLAVAKAQEFLEVVTQRALSLGGMRTYLFVERQAGAPLFTCCFLLGNEVRDERLEAMPAPPSTPQEMCLLFSPDPDPSFPTPSGHSS